jgi:hypothetical protein
LIMAEIPTTHLVTLTLGVGGMQAVGIAATSETASEYDWLNRIVAIGTGRRPPEGPVYEIFEVL